jgi:hopanoid biosynthesis associated protein HpnK
VKRLIVTGDDFGLSSGVNEAIEEAHRRGILNTASLMVGAEAAADAVARARRLPALRVGLHVVVVEGRPVLPPEQVPDLVDERGELPAHLVRASLGLFCRRRVRRQMAAEIRAQFAAFRATGLALDHVNAHNHMHLHPTVLGLIIEIGREFGMRAVRVPYEPPLASWRAARTAPAGRWLSAAGKAPWIALLRRRLRRAGLKSNQFVFGLNDSGHMHAELVTRLLGVLPDGVSEIYFHPAARRCPELERRMPAYRHQAELAALISRPVRDALQAAGIQRIAYGDL